MKSNIKELRESRSFFLFVFKIILFIVGIWYFLNGFLNGIDFKIQKYFIFIAIISFFYSGFYIYSYFVQNKQLKLLNMLPITANEAFLTMWLEVKFHIFVSKFLPLLMGGGIYLTVKRTESLSAVLRDSVISYFLFCIFAVLAFVVVQSILVKQMGDIVVCLVIALAVLAYKTTLNNYPTVYIIIAFITLLWGKRLFRKNYSGITTLVKRREGVVSSYTCREYKMFFGDKILVSNILITAGISVFFVINLVINQVNNYFIIAVMIILPVLSTTTLFLHSYEGKRIAFFKSLPMGWTKIFIPKIMVSLTITIVICAVLSIILKLNKLVDGQFVFLYLLTAAFICVHKILMDMADPWLDYKHTEELLRCPQKYKRFMWILPSYVVVLIYGSGIPFEILFTLSIIINVGTICVLICKNNRMQRVKEGSANQDSIK